MTANLMSTLSSFSKPQHFLQNVYAIDDENMRYPLVYMRNAKAACTTVILSMAERKTAMEDMTVESLNMRELHGKPTSVFVNSKAMGKVKCYGLIQSSHSVTFSFVRNPLERAASAFSDKVLGSPRHRFKVARRLGKSIEEDLSFTDFVELLTTEVDALDLDRHWRPQHKELAVGSINYNFLGALENINRDLTAILNFSFGNIEGDISDARTAYGHKTRSGELAESLPTKLKRRFESLMESDYALHEKSLGATFNTTSI